MPKKRKDLHGNRGKRSAVPGDEPKPAAGIPPCPDWLDDEAKAKWGEVTPELARIGVLTLIDGDVLACYCQSYCEYRQATRRLQREGRTFTSAKTGHKMPHPAVAQQGRARDAVRQFAALLGLDPSSRCRLHVEQSSDETDPMDEFTNDGPRLHQA